MVGCLVISDQGSFDCFLIPEKDGSDLVIMSKCRTLYRPRQKGPDEQRGYEEALKSAPAHFAVHSA